MGVTMKAWRREHFYKVVEAYHRCDATSPEFLRLSLAVHIAKSGVPKRLWALATHPMFQRRKR